MAGVDVHALGQIVALPFRVEKLRQGDILRDILPGNFLLLAVTSCPLTQLSHSQL